MINTDYEELLTGLIYEGYDKTKYIDVANRLVEMSDPTITIDEAYEMIIAKKVNDADRYILNKIGQESYDLIPSLTDATQIQDLKDCEVYLVLMEMLRYDSIKLEDGFNSQSDDYISLSKDSKGINYISFLKRKADQILRMYYCEN